MDRIEDPLDAGLDLVNLTRSLVDIDSTTGREGDAARWLARYLRQQGFPVTEQAIDEHRFNIIVTSDRPSVFLSTHVDCVPPFFPSRMEGDRIYGRGACDAKGILAAQVVAADLLRRQGVNVGLLFVVGEERGSDGARRANEASPGCRFLVNGEPTDNRLGIATRGMLRLRLKAEGQAAHSSFPALGESAIEKLVDALVTLRGLELPSNSVLGRTHYTVGLISGGVAPNVIPPSAEAEVMFRTVAAGADVRRAIVGLESIVTVEDILEVPPVRLVTIDGFDSAVFAYTTDIPLLNRWGQPLLFGPGSIHVAHTAHEFVEIGDLRSAVAGYVRIVQELLKRAG